MVYDVEGEDFFGRQGNLKESFWRFPMGRFGEISLASTDTTYSTSGDEYATNGDESEDLRRPGLLVRLVNLFDYSIGSVLAWISKVLTFVFGAAGLILLLGIVAVIPVVQLSVLGFFVTACQRVIGEGRFSAGWIGLSRGRRILGLLFGFTVVLLPLKLVIFFYQSSTLINGPAEGKVGWLPLSAILLFFTSLHIFFSVLAGARMSAFFWPLFLPFTIIKIGVRFVLKRLGVTGFFGRLSSTWLPHSTMAFKQGFPDFGPHPVLVLWKRFRNGGLFSEPAANFWKFVHEIELWTLFRRGLVVFLASIVYFGFPILFFICSMAGWHPVLSGWFYFLAVIHLLFSLNYFPWACACYAACDRWTVFLWGWSSSKVFSASPLRSTMVLLISVVLMVPVLVFRVEMIPYGLWWLLAVPTVGLSWLVWILWGWAWAKGTTKRVDSSSQAIRGTESEFNQVPKGQLVEPRQRTSFLWRMGFRGIYLTLLMVQGLLVLLSMYLAWDGPWSLLKVPFFDTASPFFIDWFSSLIR